jgi:hypothetical protein
MDKKIDQLISLAYKKVDRVEQLRKKIEVATHLKRSLFLLLYLAKLFFLEGIWHLKAIPHEIDSSIPRPLEQ